MTVQLELWHLILLLLAFFSGSAAAGRLLLYQFEARLNERFATQEKARTEAAAQWTKLFEELKAADIAEAENYRRIEREFAALRIELPREYVRREDHIRFETVINAKLDALNARFDIMLERNKKD